MKYFKHFHEIFLYCVQFLQLDYFPLFAVINLSEFIAIKGIKTQGNQLSTKKIKEINLLSPLDHTIKETEDDTNNKSDISKGNDEGQITLNL